MLRAVLARWAERAGTDVVFLTDRRYRLDGDAAFEGGFADAAQALFRSLSHLPHAPVAARSEGGTTLVVRHRMPASPAGGEQAMKVTTNGARRAATRLRLLAVSLTVGAAIAAAGGAGAGSGPDLQPQGLRAEPRLSGPRVWCRRLSAPTVRRSSRWARAAGSTAISSRRPGARATACTSRKTAMRSPACSTGRTERRLPARSSPRPGPRRPRRNGAVARRRRHSCRRHSCRRPSGPRHSGQRRRRRR